MTLPNFDNYKLREPDYLSPYPLCAECSHEKEHHGGTIWVKVGPEPDEVDRDWDDGCMADNCSCRYYHDSPPEPPDRRKADAEWEMAE